MHGKNPLARVESSAYGEDGFADRQEAAKSA
ncbi:hypothetical protein J2S50_000658 [Streptomyces sp. DSM 40167]|nr:hypothetical protein [Streptomyces sp. DSM 40167]